MFSEFLTNLSEVERNLISLPFEFSVIESLLDLNDFFLITHLYDDKIKFVCMRMCGLYKQ